MGWMLVFFQSPFRNWVHPGEKPGKGILNNGGGVDSKIIEP
jgi:hypothetical protein